MELENFKAAWQGLGSGRSLSREDLQHMIREDRHPVIRGIRWQLVIETVMWACFLAVYYDFFDGYKRPFFMNLLVSAAVILLLVHNVATYVVSRNIVKGEDLRHSLEGYLGKLRRAAVIAITARVAAIMAVMGALTAGVSWTPGKYWVLAVLVLVIALQVLLLRRLWNGRIGRLKKVVAALAG